MREIEFPPMSPSRRLAKAVQPACPELFGLHEGDARRLEYLLGPYSSEREPLLTCTITSPPYGNLKNYGHPDQVGWGQPYDEYLASLRSIFRNVARHTRDEGCLWVVIDTLRPRDQKTPIWTLEPLPFQLADQLSDVGWTLRDIIIWKKNKTVPWASPGRLRNAFEYAMFFVKTESFKYHVDRLRETDRLEQWWVKWPERYNPLGKFPENVWEIPIPTQGQWSATPIQHACPLPPDLVERMLFLSTDPGDVVFDPFAGSGVVLAEAERLGRRPIGIELVKKYIDTYERFVRPEITKRRGRDHLAEQLAHNEYLHDTILKLRVLKYGRQLLDGAAKARPDAPSPLVAIVTADIKKPSKAGKLVDAEITVVSKGTAADREKLLSILIAASQKTPTSMFGIGATIRVVPPTRLPKLTRKTLDVYVNGKHYMTTGKVRVADLLTVAAAHSADRIAPIVSNIEVSETPRAIEAPNGHDPAASGNGNGNGKVDVASNGHRVKAATRRRPENKSR
jgi:DNA modification methylase